MISKAKHISGLDTLRLVAAVWVAFSHGARFPLSSLSSDGFYNAILSRLDWVLYNGPAAVMVFFIVSGLVIHYPMMNEKKIDVFSFYARRLVRVGLPLITIIGICTLLGDKYFELLKEVLWSLYCEIFYYIIYPIFFIFIRKFRINTLYILSVILGVLLCFMVWPGPLLWDAPVYVLVIFGLPCWLLGCVLAERLGVHNWRFVGVKEIWLVRIGFLLLSIGLKLTIGILIARLGAEWRPFAVAFAYPWSFWILAVAAFFWVRQEIFFFANHKTSSYLEHAGAYSYSLYLVHNPAMEFSRRLTPDVQIHLQWLLSIFVIIICTYIFYQLVERPSHKIARKAARAVAKATPLAPSPV